MNLELAEQVNQTGLCFRDKNSKHGAVSAMEVNSAQAYDKPNASPWSKLILVKKGQAYKLDPGRKWLGKSLFVFHVCFQFN